MVTSWLSSHVLQACQAELQGNRSASVVRHHILLCLAAGRLDVLQIQ